MTIFDGIILNTILVLFPIFLYLLYLYTNKKCHNCYLVLTLLTSYILLKKYGVKANGIYLVINYLILICFIFISYKEGKHILSDHLKVSEIRKNEQLNLSLFKITHEIKNPIAVIKCYLDMLDIKNEKQVEKIIPIIKSEIDRILIILQDFNLINKLKINKDIMDINMLIEEQINKLDYLLNENNIKIKTKLKDEIYINADYDRLGQVILNLIKNSIESFDPLNNNKLITIKTTLNKKSLTLSISDNGSGMSREVLQKIKEPFYTTKIKGTGLGVSLSNEIIKAHNGKMNYTSLESKGTKVVINLPIGY